MNIYIDYNCLVSFLKLPKSRDYYECEKLLLHQLHIIYTFPKEKLLEDEEIFRLYEMFTEYRGLNEESDLWGEKSIFNTNIPLSLSSVYLIDNYIGVPNYDIIVGNQHNVLDTLKKLFIDNVYSLTKKILLTEFQWENINIKQCTDVILTDRYLLKNLFCNNFKYNIEYYFKSVLAKINHQINIVIFSEGRNNSGIVYSENKLLEAYNSIIKCFKIKPNLTFVLHEYSNSNPHDRCIISNYLVSYCGDSFSGLFKNERTYGIDHIKIKSQGFFVEISSLANINDYIIAKSIIKELNETAKKNTINGDKISNLIEF